MKNPNNKYAIAAVASAKQKEVENEAITNRQSNRSILRNLAKRKYGKDDTASQRKYAQENWIEVNGKYGNVSEEERTEEMNKKLRQAYNLYQMAKDLNDENQERRPRRKTKE